jgi:endonuclease/exonuclease/phosphatase family metal-dependent hydrolase
MPWSESIDLKIALLNAENLFLLFDQVPTLEHTKLDEIQWQKLSTSIFPNKNLSKLKELARTIKDMDPDILLLCEVGGPESLKHFNELFLEGKYSTAIIEGNSDRNIDVGFLVRRNLPFYFDLTTNKHRLINFNYESERVLKVMPEHKLSRDCAELKLFQRETDKPFLNILLTHLKSRLDPEKKDPNGFARRQAELKTVVDIANEVYQRNPNVPLILAGDFNGNASLKTTDEEFKYLYQNTQMIDVLEAAGLADDKRATFAQVRNGQRSDGRQIDFCFLTPKAAQYLDKTSAGVYRYKDSYGFALDLPTTMEAKLELPSDHYPIFFKLQQLPFKA